MDGIHRDCYHELKDVSKVLTERLDKLGREINRFISAVGRNHKRPKRGA